MITIKLKCVDQTLTILNAPIIASGGIQENNIEVEFCSKWDGFAKTGVFYRNENDVYNVLLVNNKCVIPHEVLKTKGSFYFGVFGIKDNVRYTTEILKYNIEQGSYILGSESLEPTPDIYTQILDRYGEINEKYENIFNDLKGAVGDMCAKGFVNHNDNEEFVGFWVGTQAEYDALEREEVGIYYIIKDAKEETSADNVSKTIDGMAIKDIFETDPSGQPRPKVLEAVSSDNSLGLCGVSGNDILNTENKNTPNQVREAYYSETSGDSEALGGINASAILETNSSVVKKATLVSGKSSSIMGITTSGVYVVSIAITMKDNINTIYSYRTAIINIVDTTTLYEVQSTAFDVYGETNYVIYNTDKCLVLKTTYNNDDTTRCVIKGCYRILEY